MTAQSALKESKTEHRGLGRGLAALLGDEPMPQQSVATAPAANSSFASSRNLPIDLLYASKYQPRKKFDETELEALIRSVQDKGVLQPILVRKHPDKAAAFEIIAGERRWRAAQLAGLTQVPVEIRDLTDRECLEISLIENIQRQALTPLEEAEGFQRLMDEFGHTQEEVAQVMGKSRSYVANTLRLLVLPEEVQTLIQDGQLSAGHARTLVNLPQAKQIANDIIKKNLNVRQTEDLVRQLSGRQSESQKSSSAAATEKSTTIDPNIRAVEQELAQLLGLKVTLQAKSASAGSITVHYQSLDQLETVLKKLRHNG